VVPRTAARSNSVAPGSIASGHCFCRILARGGVGTGRVCLRPGPGSAHRRRGFVAQGASERRARDRWSGAWMFGRREPEPARPPACARRGLGARVRPPWSLSGPRPGRCQPRPRPGTEPPPPARPAAGAAGTDRAALPPGSAEGLRWCAGAASSGARRGRIQKQTANTSLSPQPRSPTMRPSSSRKSRCEATRSRAI
jgi:hypothetical protein